MERDRWGQEIGRQQNVRTFWILSRLLAKPSEPFRGHFWRSPVCFGARPFEGWQASSFWECRQRLSMRASWDVTEPTHSLSTIEWEYWESLADRKASVFPQWSLHATEGTEWQSGPTVTSNSERRPLRTMQLSHQVTRAEKDRDSWEQPGDSPFGDSLKRGRHSWDGSKATPRLL